MRGGAADESEKAAPLTGDALVLGAFEMDSERRIFSRFSRFCISPSTSTCLTCRTSRIFFMGREPSESKATCGKGLTLVSRLGQAQNLMHCLLLL